MQSALTACVFLVFAISGFGQRVASNLTLSIAVSFGCGPGRVDLQLCTPQVERVKMEPRKKTKGWTQARKRVAAGRYQQQSWQ